MHIKRTGKYELDNDNILVIYSPRLFKSVNRALDFYYPESTSITQGEEPLFKLSSQDVIKLKNLLRIKSN